MFIGLLKNLKCSKNSTFQKILNFQKKIKFSRNFKFPKNLKFPKKLKFSRNFKFTNLKKSKFRKYKKNKFKILKSKNFQNNNIICSLLNVSFRITVYNYVYPVISYDVRKSLGQKFFRKSFDRKS